MKVYEKGDWQRVDVCRECGNVLSPKAQHCLRCGNYGLYNTLKKRTVRRWCYTTKRTLFNMLWEFITFKAKGYWEYK